MFEIWWRERLLDVVPAVSGEVPEGLTVRSRASAPVEPVRGEATDWRFAKVLAMCLLGFVACVMVMTLTPVGEGGEDDGFFRSRVVIEHFVLPPVPFKKLPQKFTAQRLQQLFNVPVHEQPRVAAAHLLQMFDDSVNKLSGGHGGGARVDALLEALTGSGGGSGGGPDLGGPRGDGPGIGPAFGFVGKPGTRLGPGATGGELHGKNREGPPTGPFKLSDGLPRDVVAKIIRKHFTEMKYCYERELQHASELAGKVSVQFVIGPTGEVVEASIAESTLSNSAVEQCMLERVRRWRFPEPAGGGTVEVNHPWIFRGAGDNDP